MAQAGAFSTHDEARPVDGPSEAAQSRMMNATVIWLAGLLLLALSGHAAARVPEVLAFGDSLTAGLGLPADAAFPSRLEARLKAEGTVVHVVNAGVSGDTTAGGRARLDDSGNYDLTLT